MAGVIDGTSLSAIDLLDDKQLETIELALKKLSDARESYLLSEKVNDALVESLENDELDGEISSKIRRALRSPADLLDSCNDVDGIEEREPLAILGLSTNLTDMENNRLTLAEDSRLFMKVHDKLLSWCSHAQTLEKILRQLGLTDYVDQPGDVLLNDNQCQISRLRRDLCRLIEKRAMLSKEMQSMQIEDGAIINDSVEELKNGSTVAHTMTAEEARTRAREIQNKIEAVVAGKDLDPVAALKKLHRMLDKETETKELTRKKLNAKLVAYKQLEAESEFAAILKSYLKAKSAAAQWKWTLDELRVSSEINM